MMCYFERARFMATCAAVATLLLKLPSAQAIQPTPIPSPGPGGRNLLMSTGLGSNGTTNLPLISFPSGSSYFSDSCVAFATPVVAMASGTATSFTFSLSEQNGANIAGFMLAVFPDSGSDSPGYPPLFDAMFSAATVQPINFGSNTALYTYSNQATWRDFGTFNINFGSNGTGLGTTGAVNAANQGATWNTHYGKTGIPLVAGTKYWVAFAVPSNAAANNNNKLYMLQASSSAPAGEGQTAPGSAGTMMATLLPSGSSGCPSSGNDFNRWMTVWPYVHGGPSWTRTTAIGTGLAINFCGAAAADSCMNMPLATGRRLGVVHLPARPPALLGMAGAAADEAAAVAVAAPVAAAAASLSKPVSPASAVAAPAPRKLGSALAMGSYSTVPSLVASTGLSWAAPAKIVPAAFLSGCALFASPVTALASSTVGFIAASVSVTSPGAQWRGWYATSGTPYPPALNFGVYADAAGSPGGLLWSAQFSWRQLTPVNSPARTPGSPFWRSFNTLSVNLTNITALPPLTLAAGTTYWLAIGAAGSRVGDGTASNAWDFQQSTAALLPAGGYAAKTVVLSGSAACSNSSFPAAGASGGLVWTAASSGPATGGPAISLCDASSATQCTALQAPPARTLPVGTVASPSATLVSTGISPGSTGVNAVPLPDAYGYSGCTLTAAPVQVLASGQVATIVFSVSVSGNAHPNGFLLGVYDDAGGKPGNPLWTAFIDRQSLALVSFPTAGLGALEDWRFHNTVAVNLSQSGLTVIDVTTYGNILLGGGGPGLYLLAGETVWVAFSGIDSQLTFQEAGDFSGVFPGYSVQQAVLSKSATCAFGQSVGSANYPSVEVFGAFNWTANTSVTATGLAVVMAAPLSPNFAAVLPPPTPSNTPAPTTSTSLSSTVSITASVSVTPSVSVSVSVSPSVSVTGTVSPSVSVSATVSPSVSVTGTVSGTASITSSVTVTPSVSSTGSLSASPSSSATGTASYTETPTGTPSNSQTASQSNTASGTSTLSETGSGTASGTQTPSITSTGTGSGTITSSASPSGTASNSRTGSVSPSLSASPSGTPSSTLAPSVSASVPPSASPSTPASHSLSASSSASPTAAASLNASAAVVVLSLAFAQPALAAGSCIAGGYTWAQAFATARALACDCARVGGVAPASVTVDVITLFNSSVPGSCVFDVNVTRVYAPGTGPNANLTDANCAAALQAAAAAPASSRRLLPLAPGAESAPAPRELPATTVQPPAMVFDVVVAVDTRATASTPLGANAVAAVATRLNDAIAATTSATNTSSAAGAFALTAAAWSAVNPPGAVAASAAASGASGGSTSIVGSAVAQTHGSAAGTLAGAAATPVAAAAGLSVTTSLIAGLVGGGFAFAVLLSFCVGAMMVARRRRREEDSRRSAVHALPKPGAAAQV